MIPSVLASEPFGDDWYPTLNGPVGTDEENGKEQKS